MKDDLFRHLKKEIVEIRDRNSRLTPDNAFTVWFLRAFVVENEAAAVQALRGGARDKGVDALFVDHESRFVFLVQAKYHQGSRIPSEKRSDVIALADLGRALMLDDTGMFKALRDDADETVKQALEDARSAIHRRNYRLSLQFVTTGKVSTTHRREAEQRLEDWQGATFESYSRKDLLRLMQDYIEGAAPPTPTISLPVLGQEVFKKFDPATGISSWIFSMRGADAGALFNEIGIRLFARNIRGYLGKTEVNRNMHSTLHEEPEYFWYYNNGITIVCDEARQIIKGGANHLRITNGQIINGQQTTRVLAEHTSTDAEVLVKLVEIPRDQESGHSTYSHVVSEIVSATNLQNAISQSDLKSNDAEQVRVERELRKLGYQYLRKSMSKAEARRSMGGRSQWLVKKEEMARAVGACLLDPLEVRLGRDRLFEDDVYPKIFAGRSVSEYLTFYWLNRHVSYWGRWDRRRGYARWVVLNFVWSLLAKPLSRPEMRDRFRRAAERHWKYNWELRPLYRLANSTFSVAMAFYRANRKRDGVIQDESTFFKHKGLHRDFERFWRRMPKSRRSRDEKRGREFVQRLGRMELN